MFDTKKENDNDKTLSEQEKQGSALNQDSGRVLSHQDKEGTVVQNENTDNNGYDIEVVCAQDMVVPQPIPGTIERSSVMKTAGTKFKITQAIKDAWDNAGVKYNVVNEGIIQNSNLPGNQSDTDLI